MLISIFVIHSQNLPFSKLLDFMSKYKDYSIPTPTTSGTGAVVITHWSKIHVNKNEYRHAEMIKDLKIKLTTNFKFYSDIIDVKIEDIELPTSFSKKHQFFASVIGGTIAGIIITGVTIILTMFGIFKIILDSS